MSAYGEEIGTSGVFLRLHYAQGYGGPDQWTVNVIHRGKNKLLDQRTASSEYAIGKAEVELKTKWSTVINAVNYDEILAAAPPASPTCTICGGHTLDGCTSCVEELFCKNCQGRIAEYQEKYRERVAAAEKAFQQRQEEARKKKIEGNKQRLARAFHWKDGWYFRRVHDPAKGDAVEILQEESEGEFLSERCRIPLHEWQSIVDYVENFYRKH
jgi:hypothetical protein